MRRPISTAIPAIVAVFLAACSVATANPPPSPAAAAATAVSGLTETPEECMNRYYPVINGARWVYTASGGFTGSYTRTITAIQPDGFSSRVTLPGGVSRLETWACDDGIIAQQPGMGLGGMIQPGDDGSAFQLQDTSGVTVPDNLGPGAFWNQESIWQGAGSASEHILDECRAGSTEVIIVPAGRFDALRADCRSTRNVASGNSSAKPPPPQVAASAAIWYALGVGIVRVEYTLPAHPPSILELNSYRLH